MRLSLYSQTVKEGEDHEAIFNDGAMRRKITDVRVESTLQITSDKEVVRMLSLHPMGCMVYLIKTLSGRRGDYRALIVAVPKEVAMSAAGDLPGVIESVARLMSENGDPMTLRPLFEKEYKVNDFGWSLPDASKRYAYRCYGNGQKAKTLADLLGDTVLQMEYAAYEGVYLLHEKETSLIRSEAMDNLSNHPVKQPAIVSPPLGMGMPAGCQLMLNGAPFTQPVLSYLGSRMKLQLHREGCVDHDFFFEVKRRETEVVPPSGVCWMRRISLDSLMVMDEDRQPLNLLDGVLRIQEATECDLKHGFLIIEEDKAHRVHLEYTRPGFDTFRKIDDLTKYNPQSPLMIPLSRERVDVTYKIGQQIKFVLKRTFDKIEQSPLPEYDVVDRKDMVVKLRSKWRKKGKKDDADEDQEVVVRRPRSKWPLYRLLVGLGIGLLIGLAGGWLTGKSYGVKMVNRQMKEEAERKEQLEQMRADSLLNVQMAAYFDSIPKWKMEEMDSVFDGRLNGLYSALNTYNFVAVERIVEDRDLSGSKQWAILDSALNVINEKKEYLDQLKNITKNVDEGGTKFFSPDGTITIDIFLKKLEEAKKAVDEKAP